VRHRGHLSAKERECRSRLARIAHDKPLLKGGLVTMSRTCGRKGCKCNRGEKHVSLYLAAKAGGKPMMIFIPPVLEEEVRAAVKTYKDAAAGLEEVSRFVLERLQEKKARARTVRKPGR